MKRATIIHHQGYGDIFSNISICNYYSKIFDELVIFTIDENRKNIIDSIYKDKNNINCVIPKYVVYDGIQTCVNCITLGSENTCPRDTSQKCNFIDYSDYSDYTNIKVGGFNNYNEWEKFKSKSYSFSHAFYEYNNLDNSVRIGDFKIHMNSITESSKLLEFNELDYIVTHEDKSRNILISSDSIQNSNRYELNNISNIMVDQIGIIERAKEIHMIDSSYSVLIYFLSFHNEKIKNIPKFLYKHPHQRDFNIYRQPVADNWYFV